MDQINKQIDFDTVPIRHIVLYFVKPENGIIYHMQYQLHIHNDVKL